MIDNGTWIVREDGNGSTNFTDNFISGTLDSLTVNSGGFTINLDAVNGASSASINEAITGVGGVTKTGDGVAYIGRGAATANTYTGLTDVQAGSLLLGANATTIDSDVSIDSGATFGGRGTANGNIVADSGSFLSPGLSTDVFNVGGDVDLGGTLLVEYDELDSEQIDVLNVAGDLDISTAALDFADISAGPDPLTGPSYIFATYGTLTGTEFASVTGLPANFVIDYAFGGNNIALVNLIPEPGTLALGLLGLFAIGGVRSRQED